MLINQIQNHSRCWSSLLVCHPSETTQEEELPLVTAHADILKGTVNHLRLAYKVEMLDLRPDNNQPHGVA